MKNTMDKNTWVYVVVQNPGENETIVGQRDAENDILFIPVFRDRDTALQGITQLVKEPGQKFEIQAIIFSDLLQYAGQERSLLFMLDGAGRILAKLTPDGRTL